MPRRKKKEYDDRINQAKSVLSLIYEDRTTPRNIRRAAKDAFELLEAPDQTQAVRAAQAINILDDISQDPHSLHAGSHQRITRTPTHPNTHAQDLTTKLAVNHLPPKPSTPHRPA
jgi:uncharacterized protein (UPF0147 family)